MSVVSKPSWISAQISGDASTFCHLPLIFQICQIPIGHLAASSIPCHFETGPRQLVPLCTIQPLQLIQTFWTSPCSSTPCLPVAAAKSGPASTYHIELITPTLHHTHSHTAQLNPPSLRVVLQGSSLSWHPGGGVSFTSPNICVTGCLLEGLLHSDESESSESDHFSDHFCMFLWINVFAKWCKCNVNVIHLEVLLHYHQCKPGSVNKGSAQWPTEYTVPTQYHAAWDVSQ